MNNLTTTAEAAITGAMTGFYVVLSVIAYVLMVVAWWKIFVKAGEKGWKALIPFYNFYIQIKISWRPLFFWIMMVISVISGLGGAFNSSLPPAVAGFTGVIQVVLSIALAVFMVIASYRLSKAFGHGKPFAAGLFFFNFIFMLILGFGKSKYVGNVYLQKKQKK